MIPLACIYPLRPPSCFLTPPFSPTPRPPVACSFVLPASVSSLALLALPASASHGKSDAVTYVRQGRSAHSHWSRFQPVSSWIPRLRLPCSATCRLDEPLMAPLPALPQPPASHLLRSLQLWLTCLRDGPQDLSCGAAQPPELCRTLVEFVIRRAELPKEAEPRVANWPDTPSGRVWKLRAPRPPDHTPLHSALCVLAALLRLDNACASLLLKECGLCLRKPLRRERNLAVEGRWSLPSRAKVSTREGPPICNHFCKPQRPRGVE